MYRTILPLTTLALAAACSTPNPPTVSAADVNRAYAEARAIGGLPFTATEALPTGTVSYTGKLGVDVSGDLDGALLGDMQMRVAFADNTVGGNVSNINFIDSDGRPDQRMDGRLVIDGYESAGRIDAFASGVLQGVDRRGQLAETDVLLTLDGNVHSDRRNGDAVFGEATGSGIGDLRFEADGVFFGRAN